MRNITRLAAAFIGALTMLTASSCDYGEDIEKVSLTAQTVSVEDRTATISVTTKMCADAAYTILPKTEQQPTAEEVLKQGTKVETNTTAEVQLNLLSPLTEYVMTVAAKGHFGRVLSQTLTFTTSELNAQKLARVFDASYTDKNDIGLYSLILTSGDTDEYGTPSSVGDITLSLDLYAALDDDTMNPTLPDGTYSAGSKTAGSFDPSYTYVITRTGEGTSTTSTTTSPIISGTVTVTHEGDNYTILVNGQTFSGDEVLAQYTGPIAFTYNASSEYKDFTEDQNVTMEYEQGRYWANWFYPHADDFALEFFTGQFDENGKQTDGYYLYIPAWMPKLADYNTSTPLPAEGTYTITAAKSTTLNWIPYDIQQGEKVTLWEQDFTTGAYLTRIDASTGKRYMAVLTAGTMTVKKNGNGYSVVLDAQTAAGIKVKATYDGTIGLTNYCDNDTNPQTPQRPWSTLSGDVNLNFNSTTTANVYFMGEDLKRGYYSWIVQIVADPQKDDYVTLEMLTPVSAGTSFPTHTYDVNDNLTAYTALPGFTKYGGGDVAYCWYGDLNSVDSEGYATTLAPINSGTISVTANSSSNYTFAFDTKDDAGHSITGSFTGTTNFYDATKSEAKKRTARRIKMHH